MVSDPLVLSVRSLVYISVDSDPIGYYLILDNLNTSFCPCPVAFLPVSVKMDTSYFSSEVYSLGDTLKCLHKIPPRNSHECKFILDSVPPSLAIDVGIPTYIVSES
jgi:hypothetical protein